VRSPCNPLIEDYAQIFYMIDKGDILSIQCKMSLRGPKIIRKVDGLSLNSTETSLQLSNLIRLIENFSSDNLYNKPRCHAVSMAFSITKNTAAVDILLLKFKVTWSISLIH
jgi:hypothetical protein